MQQPSIITFESETAHIIEQDIFTARLSCNSLKELLRKCERQLATPTLIRTDGKYFSGILPENLRNLPMLVLWLPNLCHSHALDLVLTPPSVSNVISPNYQQCGTLLIWDSGMQKFAVALGSKQLALNKGEHSSVVVMCLTPIQLSVALLRFADFFWYELQLAQEQQIYFEATSAENREQLRRHLIPSLIELQEEFEYTILQRARYTPS